MAWKPGQQKVARDLESPYEDVPDHLRQALTDWAIDSFFNRSRYLQGDRYREVALHMRLRAVADPKYGVEDWKLECQTGTFVLDLIEALLELYGYDLGRGTHLAKALERGNSAYAIAQSGRGLELRIAEGVRESVSAVVNSASGSGGEHLATAWNTAYGRTPDPVRSFSESIKAVESALASHVAPNNARQTLGTMIRDIRAKPTKWSFVIEGNDTESVGMMLKMMGTLWDGQTSRHGGASSRNETSEEARAAVHIASALVQFGVGGAFRMDTGTPA